MDSAGPSCVGKVGSANLRSASFLGLLTTQFLGAVNDNMFRWLAVPIGKEKVGVEYAALALSAGLASFVLPYVLLAAPAGYLADRFSKRQVIVACKVAEVVIVALGLLAVWFDNIIALYVVVALLGAQAALFGPSKFGSIPEIVRPSHISSANGLVGLTTVIAVVIGTIAGNSLYTLFDSGRAVSMAVSAVALLGVAVVGLLSSLLIEPLVPSDPDRKFPINFPKQTYRDLRLLGHNRALLRVAAGSAFFWALASLAQMNVDLFAISELNLDQKAVGTLLAVLSVGVGLGSVLAGIWSSGKVELGIVPLGAIGIAISSMLLFTVPDPTDVRHHPFMWTCTWLMGLGICSGLFDVPLSSFLQHRSPAQSRGSILAASNFLTFSGMLVAAFLFWLLRSRMEMSAREIFLLAGLATLPVAAYALVLLPQATLRFVVWLATHTIYKVRIEGRENLPVEGGALLAANHISWADGALLLTVTSRPIRMIVWAPYAELWWARGLARIMGVIPLRPTAQSIRHAIRTARKALEDGELVCIFPEGAISRSGQLGAFKPGLLALVKGSATPVIPVYLDELWGSIFSFKGGRFFWKVPQHWPYPVSIQVGKPLVAPAEIHEVRRAVEHLGVEAVEKRKSHALVLPRELLRQCRTATFRSKIADSTGADLTGGKVLLRTLILRRLLLRHVLGRDEKFVGVLLPPSVAGVLVSAALALARRVAVNLNYTLPSETLNECIAQCGIRHVLTSRKFMERVDLKVDAELVYLEDLREKVDWTDKLLGLLGAYFTPVLLLEQLLGITKLHSEDLVTVIFTSGSTGHPKGVMLSYGNVGSNTEAIDQVIHLNKEDVICGILPFFHSFGFTVTLWSVLALDVKGVYHFSPLDAKQIGKLCHEHGATFLVATPTFLRSYLRRCAPEDFKTLDVVVAGAEKLPRDLADAFEEKFGVRPVEGYGTTELSPLVSVNIPPSREYGGDLQGLKEGSVGRPVPGVGVKTVHPETGAELPIGEAGLLLVKGPNVMLGYLNQPEATAKVIRDGWYVTGDIAIVDDDGFIHITGRQSRFSKIGGEMVPHLKIEEKLEQILCGDEQKLCVAVTAIPDAQKGERLVVVHTPLEKSSDQIRKELAAAGLPNLWIPGADSFLEVDEIPVLGTGKLDLQGLKQLANQRLGAEAPSASPKR